MAHELTQGRTGLREAPTYSPGLLAGVLAWVLTWAGVRTLAEANLDPYGDMLESWVWGQTWSWGTYKHPPLMAWVSHLWFLVWPTGTGAYKLLAYVTVGLGLLGIVRLAALFGLRRWLWPVLVVAVCGLPESTLSAKYNANAILLALWPWVGVAWVQAFVLRRGIAWCLALGALAALGMLGKYYTGVMLLGLFASSLLTPWGRHWYRTPQPWLALFSFVICLAPHAWWQMSHGWASVAYVEEQGDGHIAWRELWHFALSPLLYWGLAWLAAVLLIHPQRLKEQGLLHRLITCWQPMGWGDTLFWMAVSPWFISLIFGLTGFVNLSLPWAIPIGFAYPVLWVRNLTRGLPGHASDLNRRAAKVHVTLLAGLLALGPVLARHYIRIHDHNYFLPRQDAAALILSRWHAQHPATPLHWVGGQWSENGFLAFYGDPHLFSLPGTPDDPRAQINPDTNWAREGGVLICKGGWLDDTVSLPQPESNELMAFLQTPCAHQAQDWLSRHHRPVTPHWVRARRDGAAFPNAPTYVYVTFDYLP